MIQASPEDIEQIRERIRKMTDLELRKYGDAARDLSDPKKNFSPPNPAIQDSGWPWMRRWRRRRPRTVLERLFDSYTAHDPSVSP
jgi:hypothetical protein